MRTLLKVVLIAIAALLALVAIAVLTLTNTDWGRERVRRLALGALRPSVHGTVRLGSIEGNLLSGLGFTDLTITDSAGRPFVSVARGRVRYDVRALLSKRIVLTTMVLDTPVIVLDRPPGGTWNFARIFASRGAKPSAPGFGSWITLDDVRLRDGRLVVRMPWAPSDTLHGAALDSAVQLVLGGAGRQPTRARPNIVAVAGGYQRLMNFDSIQAVLPHVRLADPDTAVRLVQVGSLAMVAYPFRPPAATLRDLRGVFRLASDSLWFRDAAATLPSSRLRLTGRYTLGAGDLALTARADTLGLGDFRWLYPPLPDSGGGSLRLAMAYHPMGTSDYTVRDLRLAIGPATLTGRLGMSMDTTPGSFRVHDTDLRFANVGTALIERVVPGVTIPRPGTLGGQATLSGSERAMHVDADVAFDDAHGGRSRVLATGGVGVDAAGGVRLDGLRLRFAPVQVDLARAVRPGLPIDGVITGTAMVDGSPRARLTAQATLVHEQRGTVSRVDARATYVGATNARDRWADVDVRFAPLALATPGRFAPALGLHGTATGRVHVVGSLGSLMLVGNLQLPGGGTLEARGSADVASREKQYDITTRLHVFNLRSVTSRGPETAISAVARAAGRGLDPRTMRSTLAADISHSAVDSVPFDSLHVRVAIANGMATIDSSRLTSSIANALVSGTFGLAPGRQGTLTYTVSVDSLSGLRRFLPRGDTGTVAPRPGRVAAALARARADSARVAKATEVERAATGAPPPKLDLKNVPGLARDSVGGAIYTAGTVRGGLAEVEVRGRLAAKEVVVGGNAVHRGKVDYAWVGGRTPRSTIIAGALLDSVEAAGFALDSVDLRATYRKPGGTVSLAVYQDTGTSYHVRSDYALELHERELRILDLGLRFGPTQWSAIHPATIRFGARGLAVDDVELRNGGAGRISVNGRLPDSGAVDLAVHVAGLQLGDVVGLLQGDLAARGLLRLDTRLSGTRASPTMRGAMEIDTASFRGTPIPDVRTTFRYAGRELDANAELVRGTGHPLATMAATIPVNLAMSGVTGPRVLERPMRVDVRADSMPMDVASKVTDAVADVHGDVFGVLAARGTPHHPSLAGKLAVQFASFRVVPMGVTLRDIAGTIRMLGDSIVIDSLGGRAGAGTVGVRGGIGIAAMDRPSFALHITGNDALLMDNEQGRLEARANIDITGPFDDVGVTGNARILGGAIYMPTTGGQKPINLDDPTVAYVADTSSATVQSLLPTRSPLLSNLHADVAVAVSRDTWVRTADANVEVYTTGPLHVRMDRANHAMTVEGVVNTDRGQYAYLGRQFVLSHGSVVFVGDTTLNPLLQINAARQVDLAGRGTVQIQVVVSGTARQPKITLESDAQPPISESDLLSYLAFGQSSSSLLQVGGSSALAGQGTNSGQLAGKAAGLATRQLAAVAVDVMAKQLQANLARSVGADVLDITPADIPTDFSLSGVETLLAGTQVEAGKYVTRRTYVAFQARPTFVAPGFRIEHRMPKGYRIEATIEPRFLVTQPTLSETSNPRATSVFGAFLIREWRF